MAAMAAAGHRSVQFDAQPTGAYAVHLRLTPGLLEALLRAQESGESASIRFGAGPEGGVSLKEPCYRRHQRCLWPAGVSLAACGLLCLDSPMQTCAPMHCLLQAISVADASFPFRALEEHSSCDLLRVPASGAGAQLLGALRQKLVVQRNVEEERSRVRARGEEAERRGHERTAKLLSSAKAAQAGKPGRQPAATTTQRRVTPPPGSGRALTPPPQQLTASMLTAPSGRPPTHPSAPAQAVQAAATAPAPAPAKPMHKSASTGKLGLASKGGTGSALPQKASARVLQAARAGVGLRLMLIAILAERPMSKDAIKAGVAGPQGLGFGCVVCVMLVRSKCWRLWGRYLTCCGSRVLCMLGRNPGHGPPSRASRPAHPAIAERLPHTRALSDVRAPRPVRLLPPLPAPTAVLKDAAARVKSYKAPKPDDFMRTLKTVAGEAPGGRCVGGPPAGVGGLGRRHTNPSCPDVGAAFGLPRPAVVGTRRPCTTAPCTRCAVPPAEFRAPAVYVVYPVLLKELDSLPAAADPAEDRKRRSSTPPEQRGPSPKARKAGPGAAAPPAAAAAVRRAAGAKRARAADWTDDDSDADEQPAAAQRPRSQPPAAAPLVHAKAASEPALPLAAATSGASPPSVGGVPAGGSSGSGGAAAGAGGARLTRRTSSSRGSELADESWIEEHADRQPEPAAPITSREASRSGIACLTAQHCRRAQFSGLGVRPVLCVLPLRYHPNACLACLAGVPRPRGRLCRQVQPLLRAAPAHRGAQEGL